MHRCRRIRLPATQSRLRSSAQGLLRLLCAGMTQYRKSQYTDNYRFTINRLRQMAQAILYI